MRRTREERKGQKDKNTKILTLTVKETLSDEAINGENAIIYDTYAFGEGSHVEGSRTKAFGNNSHAEGYNTQALGK